MITKAAIKRRMKRSHCITRIRECTAGHSYVTQEFLYRPYNYFTGPLDRCPKCVVARARVVGSNSLTSNKKFPKRSVGIYHRFGAKMRKRECEDCKYSFITYEVESPLREREGGVPIHYCMVDLCGKPTRIRR